MARYASGKWAKAQDDRTGWKVNYKDLRTEWTGVRVHKSEWEPKHPQLTPPKRINDPQALRDPRPDTTQVNGEINYNYRVANEPLNATVALNWYIGNSNFGLEFDALVSGITLGGALGTVGLVNDPSELDAVGVGASLALGAVAAEAEALASGQTITVSLGAAQAVLPGWGMGTWSSEAWSE